MKKYVIKLLLASACLIVCMITFGTTADAATFQSTYTVKANNYLKDQTVFIKGGKTKTTTLKVKSAGTLKVSLDATDNLGKNQKIKIQLIDSKGKTIKSKTATKTSVASFSAKVTKGNYTIKITTCNISSKKTKSASFSYVLNKESQEDGTKVIDMTNSKGVSTYNYVNDSDQVVSIEVGGYSLESESRKDFKLVVKDSDGKTITSTGFNDYEYMGDYYGEGAKRNSITIGLYLKKGTYTISCSYLPNKINYFVVNKETRYTNVVTTATSKAKAVACTGSTIYLGHYGKYNQSRTHWVSVDTSKGAYSLGIYPSRLTATEFGKK